MNHRFIVTSLVCVVAAGITVTMVGGPSAHEGPGPEKVTSAELGATLMVPEPVIPSIGDLIDGASVVAIGNVVSTEEPQWNSEDGLDWTTEFEGNPEAYDTVPLVLTKVQLQLTDILDFDFESCHTPQCEPSVGDTIDVWFRGDPRYDLTDPEDAEVSVGSTARVQQVAPGDRRLFFLQWASYPVPAGVGPNVWRADAYYGMWDVGVEEDEFAPAALEQVYSLRFAIQTGLAEGNINTEDQGLPVTITSEDLARIVELENNTPGEVTVASFTLWPWEGTFQADTSEIPSPPP